MDEEEKLAIKRTELLGIGNGKKFEFDFDKYSLVNHSKEIIVKDKDKTI